MFSQLCNVSPRLIQSSIIGMTEDKSPLPLPCALLCAALESATGKHIEDWNLFCCTLRTVYMASGDDVTSICEEFSRDIRDMIIDKEESNSPTSLLCELIYEAMDSMTLKHEQKLFEDALICLYMAHKNNYQTMLDDCQNHARDIIRIVTNRCACD